ncbi:MAG: hypothetical protein CMF71_00045 [Magnetovibrio sp.]|nr:hypothetical protein [Magnetovibrio sp.]|tara:strand:+ start:9526 stop:10323 length:798 start_codon:yes stop_codon:yes gene_type:complete
MALVPLSKTKHASLKLGPVDMNEFLDLLLIPLYEHEINSVACDYPLCITLQDNTPSLRLLSSISPKHGSALITSEGKWVGRYVPTYVRHYPFFAIATGPEEKSIFIEDTSPRLQEDSGEALFEKSEPTTLLAGIVSDMTAIFESASRLQIALDALQKFKLIVPWTPKIASTDGHEATIGDIYRVDMSGLDDLSNPEFNELRELGVLSLAYGQFLSMNNLGKLVALQNLTSASSPTADLEVSLDDDSQALDFGLPDSAKTLDFDKL